MSLDKLDFESFDLLRLGLIVCDENARILYANTTVQFYLGQSAKLLKDRSSFCPSSRRRDPITGSNTYRILQV